MDGIITQIRYKVHSDLPECKLTPYCIVMVNLSLKFIVLGVCCCLTIALVFPPRTEHKFESATFAREQGVGDQNERKHAQTLARRTPESRIWLLSWRCVNWVKPLLSSHLFSLIGKHWWTSAELHKLSHSTLWWESKVYLLGLLLRFSSMVECKRMWLPTTLHEPPTWRCFAWGGLIWVMVARLL